MTAHPVPSRAALRAPASPLRVDSRPGAGWAHIDLHREAKAYRQIFNHVRPDEALDLYPVGVR